MYAASLLPYIDRIVLLEEGSVLDTGSYEDIKTRRPDMFKWDEHETNLNSDSTIEESLAGTEAEPEGSRSTTAGRHGQISSSDRGGFNRQKGNWSVYAYYGKKAGKLSLFLWVLSTLIGAISNSYSSKSMLQCPSLMIQPLSK